MDTKIKDNGTWKTPKAIKLKDGSTWKNVLEGWNKVDGTWKQFWEYPTYLSEQKLLASDRASLDAFGISVTTNIDGGVIAVGANVEDTSPLSSNGAVYIYSISGGTYVETQKLLASDKATNDRFGTRVSMSDMGILAVGADGEGTSPTTSNGAVYVYTISGGAGIGEEGGIYVEKQKLLASDRASSDGFGISVAISQDGITLAVGANGEDTSPLTTNGAVYIYTISGGTNDIYGIFHSGTYVEKQKLLASDKASNEAFGYSLSIGSNGGVIAVGSWLEDTSPTSDNGAVYIYAMSGGTYVETQKLLASDKSSTARFGSSVSMNYDASVIVVAADREDTSPTSDNGAVYIYAISGGNANNGGIYVEKQKLLASDKTSGDYFGSSVFISDIGTLAVGAYGEDTSPLSSNGAVYIYSLRGGIYVESQKLFASDIASGDSFGKSVSMGATGVLVVGADTEGTSPTNANGAVYVYTSNED